jgi:HEAT repeat protein
LVQSQPARAHLHLREALASKEVLLRRTAVALVRDVAGGQLAAQLAGLLHKLPEPGRKCLLEALGSRDHPAVRTAALESLKGSGTPLRVQALRALGSSGEPQDVKLLVSYAAHQELVLQEAAQASLQRLGERGVDAALVACLPGAPPREQIAVIRALVARRAPQAQEVCLEQARSRQQRVQLEALKSLQQIADASAADVLVDILAKTPPGKLREAAERAVWRSCSSIQDVSQRVKPILRELEVADEARQVALLPALGRLGGPRARLVVRKARGDSSEPVRDAAIRALCNWPDASVADELWTLARDGDKRSYRIWALRGYVRVVSRGGREQPQTTSEKLQRAMQLANRSEDRKLILSRLTATRVPNSLDLALAQLDDPDLRSLAIEVVVDLAEGMRQSHPDQARLALEKVQGLTENPELQMYVAKLLWNMQLKEN